MSFPKYEVYKDSGVEWLREVPEHWDVTRLRFIFDIQKRIAGADGFDVLSITQKGIKIKDIESGDGQLASDYSKYQIVKKGDFAMNQMDLLTGYVDISKFNGVTSPDYRVFQSIDKERDSPEFLLLLLQNGYHQKLFFPYGQGSAHLGRWRLPTEEFNNFCFPRPPYSEQGKISEFINRETTRIDALIAEQQRLIELLKEKRQAVISHAVTKGLDRTAPMKDSGVEWLGDMPEHWHVVPLKHIGSVRYGIGEPPQYMEIGTSLIRATNVSRGKISQVGMVFVDPKDIPVRRIVWLESGNIIVVRSGAYTGDSAIIREEHLPAIAGFDMVIKDISCNSEFLQYALLSQYLKDFQIDLEKMRAAQPHLNAEELGDCFVLLPPDESEQKTIVKFLDQTMANIDSMVEEATLGICLLQERRSALISAAVTGKIDVRNWQPPD